MINYIPIKSHIEILPLDTLQSPRGNHYRVVKYISNEVLRLNPLDVQSDLDANMEFTIIKHSLISAGWKKIIK